MHLNLHGQCSMGPASRCLWCFPSDVHQYVLVDTWDRQWTHLIIYLEFDKLESNHIFAQVFVHLFQSWPHKQHAEWFLLGFYLLNDADLKFKTNATQKCSPLEFLRKSNPVIQLDGMICLLFVIVIDLNQTGVLPPLDKSFNLNLMTITLNHVDDWSLECLFSEFLIHDSYTWLN